MQQLLTCKESYIWFDCRRNVANIKKFLTISELLKITKFCKLTNIVSILSKSGKGHNCPFQTENMKAPSTVYDIFVNTPSSVYSLQQIPVETTIYRLKSIIELRTGIPAEHQLLNLSGTALFDEFTLVDAGIRKGSVVRMLFATKVAEKLFDLANKDDISGLLNVGIQMIELSEASNVEEEKKLKAWNRNVMQRSFLAVCVACFNGSMQLLANLLKISAFDANQVGWSFFNFFCSVFSIRSTQLTATFASNVAHVRISELKRCFSPTLLMNANAMLKAIVSS